MNSYFFHKDMVAQNICIFIGMRETHGHKKILNKKTKGQGIKVQWYKICIIWMKLWVCAPVALPKGGKQKILNERFSYI